MGVCCCSLAGTAACKYCSNNPDAERPPVVRTYTTVATDSVSLIGMKKTNADKIRAMTDEELAVYIRVFYPEVCPPGNCPGEDYCYNCWLGWLKKECDE